MSDRTPIWLVKSMDQITNINTSWFNKPLIRSSGHPVIRLSCHSGRFSYWWHTIWILKKRMEREVGNRTKKEEKKGGGKWLNSTIRIFRKPKSTSSRNCWLPISVQFRPVLAGFRFLFSLSFLFFCPYTLLFLSSSLSVGLWVVSWRDRGLDNGCEWAPTCPYHWPRFGQVVLQLALFLWPSPF